MSHVYDTARQAFDPPLLLRHRHVQSILAGLSLRGRAVRSGAADMLALEQSEIVDCGQGVRLQGWLSVPASASRGMVVLLHGWEGSAHSHYMISLAGRAFDAGFEVFRLNFRDHGNTHALNEELFHSCRLDEVIAAVAAISARRRGPATYLVGYSLGGNFALRVAARSTRVGLTLARIIAVCPVLRPHSTMRALDQGLWIYREYFLRRWRRSLAAKAAAFPKRYRFGDLSRFRTLTDTTAYFVEQYTEFPDLDSYLNGYSVAGEALAGLSVPTRIITTEDDPVIPMADLEDLAHSDALDVTVARRGGHCGFLDTLTLGSWLDRQIVADLEHAAGGFS